MNVRRIVLHVISWGVALSLFSQTVSAADPEWHTAYGRHEFKGPSDQVLKYRMLDPRKSDVAKKPEKFPLVVFLHGAGERGDDNVKQLIHGMQDFASAAVQSKYPCFVVAPQCPNGQQWVDTPWTALSHRMNPIPSPSMALVIQLIDELERDLPIDGNRIYVTGLSMGGFGTWDLVQRQPQRFAAAVPVCGGGDVTLAEKISRVPVWAFHGDQDTVVKPSRSTDMVEAMRKAGGKPHYTEYGGVGHNSWAATYRDPAMYKWLFSQTNDRRR